MKTPLPSSLRAMCVTLLMLLAVTFSLLRPAHAAVPKWFWADAGAALASAESGPLCPLISACASLAVMRVQPSGVKSGAAIRNQSNSYESAGALHNRIVDGYFSSYKTFEVGQYYEFLQKNKAQLGVQTIPDIAVFEKAANTYRDISQDELLQRIEADFKAAGIKSDIVSQLRQIPQMPAREYSESVMRIENNALAARGLTPTQIRALSVFFATLRYSLSYGTP